MSNKKNQVLPFIQKVIAIRKAKGLSAEAFGKLLGFSTSGWYYVERGRGKTISHKYYDCLIKAFPELGKEAKPPLSGNGTYKRSSRKRTFLQSLFHRMGPDLSVRQYINEARRVGVQLSHSYVQKQRVDYKRSLPQDTKAAGNVVELRVKKVADAAYETKEQKVVVKPMKLERRVPWTYARGIVSLATHPDAKTLFVGFLRAADTGGMSIKDVLNDLESI